MKTLILCYSFTGKTLKVCRNLEQHGLFTLAPIREVRRRTLPGAYFFGSLKAMRGKPASILPVEEDVSAFLRIVLACPVWAGALPPAVNGFLREYDLHGKELHGLLTYQGDAGTAAAMFKQKAASAGASCGSVVTLQTDEKTLAALERDEVELYLDPAKGVCARSADKKGKEEPEA